MDSKRELYDIVVDIILLLVWTCALAVSVFFALKLSKSDAIRMVAIAGPFLALLTTFASIKCWHPTAIWTVGAGSVLLVGLGFVSLPVLWGARTAAKAKLSILTVFVTALLSYSFGAGALVGLLLLTRPQGIDLLAFFGPFWLGGVGIAGGLWLVATGIGPAPDASSSLKPPLGDEQVSIEKTPHGPPQKVLGSGAFSFATIAIALIAIILGSPILVSIAIITASAALKRRERYTTAALALAAIALLIAIAEDLLIPR